MEWLLKPISVSCSAIEYITEETERSQRKQTFTIRALEFPVTNEACRQITVHACATCLCFVSVTVMCMPTAMVQSVTRLWLFGGFLCKFTHYMQGKNISLLSANYILRRQGLHMTGALCLCVLRGDGVESCGDARGALNTARGFMWTHDI